MADVPVPSIATATPDSDDHVVGTKDGALRRFQVSALAEATRQATLAPVGVSVDWFGAAGNGTTDDTLAIRAAITAAGVGGTLLFTPGKTYLLSGSIAPLEGQTLWGYGSKLKRCAEVKSNTSTNIGTGSSPTAITVADGSLFRVGMDVTVYNGASYDTSQHAVWSVVGNVVTVGTNFSVAFPSGGTLITAFPLIYSNAAKVSVIGLEFDGNRANNASLAKWQLHAGVRLSSAYGRVQDCYVHDEVSEGMYLGGDAISARNNNVVDCGGNGIHFSGGAGAEASGNYVKNCNILGTAPGHADGLICFSNATEYAHIIGNYLDTGICGVASIDSDDNSSVVITGNIIRNCTTTAIEGYFPAGTKGGKCVIANNLIYESKNITIRFDSTFAVGSVAYNWIVSGNYLGNTRIFVSKATGILIEKNIISMPADTTNPCIWLEDCQQASVIGNQITGGGTGIVQLGSNTAAVKISGNTLMNNYSRSIDITVAGTGRACSIEGNTIVVESDYTTIGAYIGISLQNNWSAINNVMDIRTTSTQSCILCPNGAAGVNGAIVQGNIIRSGSITYDIRAAGGSQNNFIVGNYTTKAVSNGGGVSNTVAGNYTIN